MQLHYCFHVVIFFFSLYWKKLLPAEKRNYGTSFGGNSYLAMLELEELPASSLALLLFCLPTTTDFNWLNTGEHEGRWVFLPTKLPVWKNDKQLLIKWAVEKNFFILEVKCYNQWFLIISLVEFQKFCTNSGTMLSIFLKGRFERKVYWCDHRKKKSCLRKWAGNLNQALRREQLFIDGYAD